MAVATLTVGNFEKGMLVDDEWMAGISKEPEGFSAFIVDHQTGVVLAQQTFEKAQDAVDAMCRIPRSWKYEATGGCSGDRCAEGQCKGTGCKLFTPASAAPGSDEGPVSPDCSN